MKAKIDDKWHIEVHAKGHTLYKKLITKDEKGNNLFQSEGHYNKLEHALVKIAKLNIIEKHEELELKDYLDELKKEIKRLRERLYHHEEIKHYHRLRQ